MPIVHGKNDIVCCRKLPIGSQPIIQLQKTKPNGDIVRWEVPLMSLWQDKESSIPDVGYSFTDDGATVVNISITNPYILAVNGIKI